MSTAPHLDSRVAMTGSMSRAVALKTRTTKARKTWRLSLPFVFPIAIRVIPGPSQILAYVWSMGYAVLGRRQAIVALVMLWLFNMFTHAFGRPPGGAAIVRHLTLFTASLSVLVIHAGEQPRTRTPRLIIWTGVLNMLLIIHSVFCSTMPDISVLKAISFTVAIHTLLAAWSSLSPQQRAQTESQLWGTLYGVAVLSTPLVASGSGYVKNNRGFQGLLEHPQAFGPIMAILSVWLFATWLTDRRMPFVLKALLGLTLAWVYLAQARIGAVVLIVGVMTAIVTGPFTALMNHSLPIPRLMKRRLAVATTGMVVLLIVAGPWLNDKVQAFVAKSGKSTTAIEAAWESRGHLIEAMRENIRDNPFTGIGLGVASSPDQFYAVVRDPVFGLAIMATVEKGVLPVAMVEEMGWPLALLYALWFIALLLMAVRAGPRYAGVCAAALTNNISEAVFFSPGGGGLIVQILVTMAATAPPAREDPIVAPATIPLNNLALVRSRASA